MSEAVYFVTFRVKDGSLSPDELKIIFDHILAGNGRFYLLISLVLMPDHGHIIFKSFPQYSLQRVMKGIKGGIVASRESIPGNQGDCLEG